MLKLKLNPDKSDERQLLNNALTAKQFGQFSCYTQQVIIDHAEGIHNLMTEEEDRLSINNIWGLAPNSLIDLARSPDGINAVRQLEGFTFDKLTKLNRGQITCICFSRPARVNAVRKLGATFDELANLGTNQLSELLENPADKFNVIIELRPQDYEPLFLDPSLFSNKSKEKRTEENDGMIGFSRSLNI